MKSKTTWLGISVSLLSALSNAQGLEVVPSQNAPQVVVTHDYSIMRDTTGGVTVINKDGSSVYVTAEQVETIKRLNLSQKPSFQDSVNCARLKL